MDTSPILHRLSCALIAVLVTATIWLLKIFLVKVRASSFYVTTFFDRMKESVIHHYILKTLFGEPLLDGSDDDDKEENEKKMKKLMQRAPLVGMMVWSKMITARVGGSSRRIDIERLRWLSMVGRSACSIRHLVRQVRKIGHSLSMLDRTMDHFGNTEDSSRGEPLAHLEEDVGTVGRAFIKSRGE